MLAPSASRSSAAPLLVGLLLLNGLTVSTLYGTQAIPIVGSTELDGSIWTGLMPSAALAGYAIGVALLAVAARDLTTANGLGIHALSLGLGLSAAAVAPAGPLLTMACVAIGMGCSLTQRALACAVSAVSQAHRGALIGCLVASGLTGIVVARAAVPAASLALGWRTVLIVAAAAICIAGLAAAIAGQRLDRRRHQDDPAPLPSAWALLSGQSTLRRAAIRQACVFAAFNGGWAVFPHALGNAGLAGAVPMGIVAVAGAASALSAGLLCRRCGPERVAQVGVGAVMLALTASLAATGAGPVTFAVMTLLDVGTQAVLVANQAQAQAQATSPATRGRIAAIVTTIGFAAGAAGAALGNAFL